MPPTGIEHVLPPWKGDVLPLDEGGRVIADKLNFV